MLATALTLAVVLTFAGVFWEGLFGGVSHRLDRDTRFRRTGFGRISADGSGPGKKTGESSAGNYCSRWLHGWIFFSVLELV